MRSNLVLWFVVSVVVVCSPFQSACADVLVGSMNGTVHHFSDDGTELLGTYATGNYSFGGCIGPDNHLYSVSMVTNQIYRTDPVTGTVESFASESPGSAPSDVAFVPDANIYVSHDGNTTITRVDGTTGESLGVFADVAGYSTITYNLTFGPDENLYVTCGGGVVGGSRVLRFNGTSGAYMDIFAGVDSSWENPLNMLGAQALRFEDDYLYVTDSLKPSPGPSYKVLRYDATTGEPLDTFVPHNSGGLDNPSGILFTDGGVLVTGLYTDGVLRYDSGTGAFLDEWASLTRPTFIEAWAIPEPSAFMMLMMGLVVFLAYTKKRRKNR